MPNCHQLYAKLVWVRFLTLDLLGLQYMNQSTMDDKDQCSHLFLSISKLQMLIIQRIQKR